MCVSSFCVFCVRRIVLFVCAHNDIMAHSVWCECVRARTNYKCVCVLIDFCVWTSVYLIMHVCDFILTVPSMECVPHSVLQVSVYHTLCNVHVCLFVVLRSLLHVQVCIYSIHTVVLSVHRVQWLIYDLFLWVYHILYLWYEEKLSNFTRNRDLRVVRLEIYVVTP